MKSSVSRQVRSVALLTVILAGAAGCRGARSLQNLRGLRSQDRPGSHRPTPPQGREAEDQRHVLRTQTAALRVRGGRGWNRWDCGGDVVEPFVKPLEVNERTMRRLGNPMPADVGDGATISDHAAMAVQACTYKGEKSQYVLSIDGVEGPEGHREAPSHPGGVPALPTARRHEGGRLPPVVGIGSDRMKKKLPRQAVGATLSAALLIGVTGYAGAGSRSRSRTCAGGRWTPPSSPRFSRKARH